MVAYTRLIVEFEYWISLSTFDSKPESTETLCLSTKQ